MGISLYTCESAGALTREVAVGQILADTSIGAGIGRAIAHDVFTVVSGPAGGALTAVTAVLEIQAVFGAGVHAH